MSHQPDEGAGLPKSAFSTRGLREECKHSEATIQNSWAEAMSVFFEPRTLSEPELAAQFNPTGEIEGYIETILHPGFMTIQVAATGQTFSRSNSHISADGVDGIVFQCLHTGQICTQAANRLVSTEAGGVLIADMGQTIEAHTSEIDTYSLLLPRRAVEQLGIVPDSLHMYHRPKSSPLASILNQHIREMHQKGQQIKPQEAVLLHDPTIALIRATIEATPEHIADASPIIQRNQLLEIRRFIDRHLMNPNLDSDMISSSFGLSRASLYRLADPLGGIQRFIKNRRLKHAFQQLTTEGKNTASLTNLAYDLGFSAESTFRRAFKEVFGMSPKEARDLGMNAHREYHSDKLRSQAANDTELPTGDLLYKQWVRNLFS